MAGPFFDGAFFDGGFFGEAGAPDIPEGPRPNINERRRKKQEQDIIKLVSLMAPAVFEYFSGKRRG